MESDGKYVKITKNSEHYSSDSPHEYEIYSSDEERVESSSEEEASRAPGNVSEVLSADNPMCDNIEEAEDTNPNHLPGTNKGIRYDGTNELAISSLTETPTASSNATLAGLQKALADLTQVVLGKQALGQNSSTDQSWSGLTCPPAPASNPNIRFDNIPPFPKGTPSTCMWDAFTRYLEKFEIAISLNCITNSAQQAQLLYLALGDEMQGIIRAADLRPSLTDPDCYRRMVGNISSYFRAMTDVGAEHDKFTAMRQARGESIVAFHARLVAQVRLCKYSAEDQIRFVRSQLLKGMANRELARTARMFDYETAFVVQSATRCEAFEGDTTLSGGDVLAVSESRTKQEKKRAHHSNSTRGQSSGPSFDRYRNKRPNTHGSFDDPPSKHQNYGRQTAGKLSLKSENKERWQIEKEK